MLIDVGRITGNLKHRMVTMVAMRNVYKLMGARVVKGWHQGRIETNPVRWQVGG